MKKVNLLVLTSVVLGSVLTGCKTTDSSKVISICASESPHALILENAVEPILKEKGYELEVKVLDWTIQNDAVESGDYDANYFQHRPYLQEYDSESSVYDENYVYKKVFPTALVHFEPLRVYEGSSSASDFESKKTTATFEICSDVSNEIRALDLLVACGAIEQYETDSAGNPINIPSRITLIDEAQLAVHRQDYDYAVLPCNTALTAGLTANETLPVESDSVADLRANIIAASVTRYASDTVYKAKIDALTEAVLDSKVANYITSTWNGVIAVDQKSLLK